MTQVCLHNSIGNGLKILGWALHAQCKKTIVIIDRKLKANFTFFSLITVEREFMGKK